MNCANNDGLVFGFSCDDWYNAIHVKFIGEVLFANSKFGFSSYDLDCNGNSNISLNSAD